MSEAPKATMIEIPPAQSARWVVILSWVRWWSVTFLIWAWIGAAGYAISYWPQFMTFDSAAVRAIIAACDGRRV